MSHHTSSTLSLVYRGRYPLQQSDPPRFFCETVDGLSTDYSFHISVFPKTTRHRQLFPFFRAATQGFVLISLRCVLCGAGLRPCLAVTQSFCLFSLRRGIIWDSFAVKWNTTQSFVLISLRRVRYVCLVVFFFGGAEWRYGLYDPEDTGLVFFKAFRAV